MAGTNDFGLTRFIFQRTLGLVYLIGFVVALNQFRPLLGEKGLLPATIFIQQVSFLQAPSLFHFFAKDAAFTVAAWAGIFLSGLAITGLSDRYSIWFSVMIWSSLWMLYLSFVNVGQTFYAFGWESILLEAGFYAIFLGPSRVAPPKLIIWMLRWLLFRVMFGAGLIKLRGDPCWRDLSCLDYHYETQPMPNPLSWYLHWAPAWTHHAGVLFNHFAEVIVPFGYFFPGPIGVAAGLITLLYQGLIFASGNLSFLNFLTMILAVTTLNDRFLRAIIPDSRYVLLWPPEPPAPPGITFQTASILVTLMTAVLSVAPILNMLSARQVMNTNYNPLHLVGTYGAFGSITRIRYEVIIEGTEDPVVTARTVWREYEFKGKPGDPSRRPAQIAPYHLRIDWLMWFAAMSDYQDYPWFVPLMVKLLQADTDTLSLLKTNPFPGSRPRFIRAELYEYHFTTPEERRQTGRWWNRHLAREYFPTVSLRDPALQG